MQVVTSTNIPEYRLISQGKVRDIYEIDADTLMLVTTDRMSAFDVIMSRPVPYKGVVLNSITLFWMEKFRHIIPNHILESDVSRFPAPLAKYSDQLEGRTVLVKKAKPLAVECIVRGYLAGSGWASYKKDGTVCGHRLPAGLKESDKLDPPIFTPSTKAELGSHDENISMAEAEKILGAETARAVRDVSLAIYNEGRSWAASRGIILADTKFEFGFVNGELTLIDEVMTPDSSRFWPAQGYEPGKSQPSFDKQFLRDWLSEQPWDKTPPPPAVPDAVIEETCRKYKEAYRLLTGRELAI
ncbi:MAG: phosphoribosylaminoimidazolesuccinocarboxamide synthase [Desulfovibrionaceae bacterium]|nr:phosphoribosylaminoimidazolesuccinocarboxamide synthase [Desulfovibrionaceae bacterium]MBR5734920.1 phosphoribosylaminoimidazolesuccinocarboxamide synthase [Desulfovibrionaceae bacterium]